jgi:hypothetical protein
MYVLYMKFSLHLRIERSEREDHGRLDSGRGSVNLRVTIQIPLDIANRTHRDGYWDGNGS